MSAYCNKYLTRVNRSFSGSYRHVWCIGHKGCALHDGLSYSADLNSELQKKSIRLQSIQHDDKQNLREGFIILSLTAVYTWEYTDFLQFRLFCFSLSFLSQVDKSTLHKRGQTRTIRKSKTTWSISGILTSHWNWYVKDAVTVLLD